MSTEQKQITPQDMISSIMFNKMKMYEAKEIFESAIKNYNDSVSFLLNNLKIQNTNQLPTVVQAEEKK